MHNILKLEARNKIVEAYEGNSAAHQDRKSLKQAEVNKELDEPIYEWYVNNRALNKMIDSETLLTAGKGMASHMKVDVKRVDELWLQKWRGLYGIISVKAHGEAGDCENEKLG